ncbi:DUF2202 domain-containing protein [Acidobacteriota bacterium]
MIKKTFMILILFGLLYVPVWAQGNGNGGGNGNGNGNGNDNGPNCGFGGGIAELIASLPYEDVSVQERAGLLHMYEEEKLARDVYLTLQEKWKARIFHNIAQSEKRHMEALKRLLEKYSIPLPVEHDTVGYFANAELQNLYYQLTSEGSVSLDIALWVGATIEDLDIFDLIAYLDEADNIDIRTVYQNLMKGSRNHLRAFGRQLEDRGQPYQAQYLPQGVVDDIINSPMERGMLDENGDPIFGNTGW